MVLLLSSWREGDFVVNAINASKQRKNTREKKNIDTKFKS